VKPGMKLPGIVTNITAFGVFVDIGVHQDGLVHISELSDRYVTNPADVVKVHQKVIVTVLDVDLLRKRMALSMKNIHSKPSEALKEEENKKAKGMSPKEIKPKRFANTPFSEAFRKK